jgi:hypothetical protein
MKKYAYIKDNNNNINIWKVVGSDIVTGFYFIECRSTRCVVKSEYFKTKEKSNLLWVDDMRLDVEDSKLEIDLYGLDINMADYDLYGLDINMADYINQGIETGNRLIDEYELDWYHLV